MEGRAEELERGVAGDQLDSAGRVQHALGADGEKRALGADLVHVERRRALGDAGLGQRASHGLGEARRLGMDTGRPCHQQHCYSRRHQSMRAPCPRRVSPHGEIMPQPPPPGRLAASPYAERSSSADVRAVSSSISSPPIVYGGMKYTVLPIGRSSNSCSSAAAKNWRANRVSAPATSKAQIIPVLRKWRTRGCPASARAAVLRRALVARFASITPSSAKISSVASAARHASGLPV